jgi:hypothetical protein
MLRGRRGTSVYLVYDEDTFLAAASGDLAAAPVAVAPTARRPPAHRHRWTRALIVTLAAATAAQLVASRANHDPGSPSWPTDAHARTAHIRPGMTTTRPRPRRVEPSVTSPSASLAGRDLPRSAHHRHARRARQAAGPGHPTQLTGSPDRPPTPAAQPSSPTPRPQPAATHPGPTGTRAAHEFGFED